jgi:hypothetical protein
MTEAVVFVLEVFDGEEPINEKWKKYSGSILRGQLVPMKKRLRPTDELTRATSC